MLKPYKMIEKKQSIKHQDNVRLAGLTLLRVANCLSKSTFKLSNNITIKDINNINRLLGLNIVYKTLEDDLEKFLSVSNKRIREKAIAGFSHLGRSLIDYQPFIDDDGLCFILDHHFHIDIYNAMPTKTDHLKREDFAFFSGLVYENKIFWGIGRKQGVKHFYFPYQWGFLTKNDRAKLKVAYKRYSSDMANKRSISAQLGIKTRLENIKKREAHLLNCSLDITLIRDSICSFIKNSNNAPIILDTETTGLGVHDEVIEVAICDLEGVMIVDTLIYTERTISGEAQKIHGIRQKDLEGKVMLLDIYEDLIHLFRGREVVIYNSDYDTRLLYQSCPKLSFSEVSNLRCLMLDVSDYIGEWSDSHDGYQWHTLYAACLYFGIDPPNHRASCDARATALIYQGLLSQNFFDP